MVVPTIMRLDRECLQGWEEGENFIYGIWIEDAGSRMVGCLWSPRWAMWDSSSRTCPMGGTQQHWAGYSAKFGQVVSPLERGAAYGKTSLSALSQGIPWVTGGEPPPHPLAIWK